MRQVQHSLVQRCWYDDLRNTVKVRFPTKYSFLVQEELGKANLGRSLPLLKMGSDLLAERVGVVSAYDLIVRNCGLGSLRVKGKAPGLDVVVPLFGLNFTLWIQLPASPRETPGRRRPKVLRRWGQSCPL